MTIILLGSSGQLGSDIIRANKAASDSVELVSVPRAQLDVRDMATIEASLSALTFDAVINCTAYHNTDDVERNATAAFTINAHAVEAIARACKVRRARFFHISTDLVFSGFNKSRPYVETDCPGPINVYGASKALGENLARLAHDDVTVLRVASLFGVGGTRGKHGNFVETMIRIGQEKGQLQVINDITMCPTGTADVAKMILLLWKADAPPGIYHAVNSGQATWHEFAQEIISRANVAAEVCPVSSNEYPMVARRPTYSVLNNSKLAAVVGHVPHWTDALERYLRAKGHQTKVSGQWERRQEV